VANGTPKKERNKVVRNTKKIILEKGAVDPRGTLIDFFLAFIWMVGC